MAEPIEDIIADFDAFEPGDDSIDNEERLQILIDRWHDTPDKEAAAPAMFRVFERFPESNTMGEPGPLAHAIEETPGYEQLLANSLAASPSYYGVWMINRILESELPADVREAYIGILHGISDNESAPWSVRSEAKECLEFREG